MSNVNYFRVAASSNKPVEPQVTAAVTSYYIVSDYSHKFHDCCPNSIYMGCAIFETFVVSELYKRAFNAGQDPDCFFWRDSAGHEVDIIIDLGSTLVPIEIKSGATISKDFFNSLNYWQNLTETKVKSRAALIYGGNNSVIRNKIYSYAWWNF